MSDLECQNSKTPEPIDTKFSTGDYVGNITQQAKIQNSHPGLGIPANGTMLLSRAF